MDQISPITHTRRVLQGISGSSVLATAERTSGYGESSSETKHRCQTVVKAASDHKERTEYIDILVEIRIVEFHHRDNLTGTW